MAEAFSSPPGLSLSQMQLDRTGDVLTAWFNRPDARNALNDATLADLETLAGHLLEPDCAGEGAIRILILRGRGGIFCAGGDIAGFEGTTPLPLDALAERNRRFGRLLERLDTLPQLVIMAAEGAAVGGGLGLLAIADVVIATRDTRLAMSEVSLGLIPAQIAPFVARRIGSGHTRRLALTAERIDADEARRIGLVHHLAETGELDQALTMVLKAARQCAPGAIAATKALLAYAAQGADMTSVLDDAARRFGLALAGAEGREGIAAFLGRRKPGWAAPSPIAAIATIAKGEGQ